VELGGGTAELFGKAMVDGVLANPFEQLVMAFGIGFGWSGCFGRSDSVLRQSLCLGVGACRVDFCF